MSPIAQDVPTTTTETNATVRRTRVARETMKDSYVSEVRASTRRFQRAAPVRTDDCAPLGDAKVKERDLESCSVYTVGVFQAREHNSGFHERRTRRRAHLDFDARTPPRDETRRRGAEVARPRRRVAIVSRARARRLARAPPCVVIVTPRSNSRARSSLERATTRDDARRSVARR